MGILQWLAQWSYKSPAHIILCLNLHHQRQLNEFFFKVLPLACCTLAREKVLFIQDFLTILTAHAIDMGTCKKAKTHYYK